MFIQQELQDLFPNLNGYIKFFKVCFSGKYQEVEVKTPPISNTCCYSRTLIIKSINEGNLTAAATTTFTYEMLLLASTTTGSVLGHLPSVENRFILRQLSVRRQQTLRTVPTHNLQESTAFLCYHRKRLTFCREKVESTIHHIILNFHHHRLPHLWHYHLPLSEKKTSCTFWELGNLGYAIGYLKYHKSDLQETT